MHSTFFIAIVLTLSNCHIVYGQSEESQTIAESIRQSSNETQIALQLKFFRVILTPANESTIAELLGKRTESNSVEQSGRSQNEIEFVQPTERLTRILDGLIKTGDGKVFSKTRIILTPGVQSRYRNGKEIDFAERGPMRDKIIETTETIDSDSTVDPAQKDSIRFVGTTILATGTIESDQRVRMEMNAKFTQIDQTAKSKFPGLKTHSAATTVALEEDQSIILGGSRSTRVQVSVKRVPVIGSIPVIGAAFETNTVMLQECLTFVLATTEIVQR